MAIMSLSNALPRAFNTLAEHLHSSGSHLIPLRDHFSAEVEVLEELYEKEKLEGMPGTAEEAEESALRARTREMKLERRNVADQAFRESEIQKWVAIKEVSVTVCIWYARLDGWCVKSGNSIV